jgi:FkbM family methyltransferase
MKFLLNIFNYLELFFSYLQGKGLGNLSISVYFETKYVMNILNKNKDLIIIDAGGGFGNYSALINKITQNTEIHIFEPLLNNYNFIKKRFIRNRNITVIKAAVSNKNMTKKIFYNAKKTELASLYNRSFLVSKSKIKYSDLVKTIRLDEYIKKTVKKKIDLIKLDVEGSEFNCIMSLSKIIKDINFIQFEFGGCNADSRIFFRDFWVFFKKKDFSMFKISPFGLIQIFDYNDGYENFLTTNYLAKNNNF